MNPPHDRTLIHLIRPSELDGLSRVKALDAITTDMRAYGVTDDAAGFATAARHAELISHLLVRVLRDAAAHFEGDHDPDAAGCDAQPLSSAAIHLAEALSHYSQAAVPLTRLASLAATPRPILDRLAHIEPGSAVGRELRAARKAMAHARTALTGQPTHAATTTPPPARAATPSPRARH